MKELDDELRLALERRDPPAGFEQRVMARIGERPRVRTGVPRWWGAIAAMLLIGSTATYEYNRAERKRMEAERAKAELIFVLQTTSAEIQQAKFKLLKIARDQ